MKETCSHSIELCATMTAIGFGKVILSDSASSLHKAGLVFVFSWTCTCCTVQYCASLTSRCNRLAGVSHVGEQEELYVLTRQS
jgi:hypothetical protein